jgi:ubiquinone/menaquinone biosynthesis C-methylase UbiE
MEDALYLQRKYYIDTAAEYDLMHMHEEVDVEHELAFYFMSSLIEKYKINSVLDVGAGTGRVILDLQRKFPHFRVEGVEPVAALRERGYKKGIAREVLTEGNGKNLHFPDDQFDLVCAFGILHHIDEPGLVISEMLRVAKQGIFISDSNNFGQGTRVQRLIKQMINALGLWSVYNYIRTKGKKYQISPGDGLFYSYSVFNHFSFIKKRCRSVHLLNTRDAGINPYRTASHVALFGIKK